MTNASYDGFETPQPTIVRYCHNCARTYVYNSPDDWQVVSPKGVGHIGQDYGVTACGVDATGDRWWWRL